MLRNSGGLSLLRGRVGVQVVVDNHTIDDSILFAWVGCDQKGTTWARAHKCTNVCKLYKKTSSPWYTLESHISF